jgi:hypothetical protein
MINLSLLEHWWWISISSVGKCFRLLAFTVRQSRSRTTGTSSGLLGEFGSILPGLERLHVLQERLLERQEELPYEHTSAPLRLKRHSIHAVTNLKLSLPIHAVIQEFVQHIFPNA